MVAGAMWVLVWLKAGAGLGWSGLHESEHQVQYGLGLSVMTMAATAMELLCGGLLISRRHWIKGACGVIALGICFVAWMAVQSLWGRASGRCSCFGPYDLTGVEHLAVACGMIIAGGLLLMTGQPNSLDAGSAGKGEGRSGAV